MVEFTTYGGKVREETFPLKAKYGWKRCPYCGKKWKRKHTCPTPYPTKIRLDDTIYISYLQLPLDAWFDKPTAKISQYLGSAKKGRRVK